MPDEVGQKALSKALAEKVYRVSLADVVACLCIFVC